MPPPRPQVIRLSRILSGPFKYSPIINHSKIRIVGRRDLTLETLGTFADIFTAYEIIGNAPNVRSIIRYVQNEEGHYHVLLHQPHIGRRESFIMLPRAKQFTDESLTNLNLVVLTK